MILMLMMEMEPDINHDETKLIFSTAIQVSLFEYAIKKNKPGRFQLICEKSELLRLRSICLN